MEVGGWGSELHVALSYAGLADAPAAALRTFGETGGPFFIVDFR